MEDLWTEANVTLINDVLVHPQTVTIDIYSHYPIPLLYQMQIPDTTHNGYLDVKSFTLSLVVISVSWGVSPSSSERSMMLFCNTHYENMVFKIPLTMRPV